MPTPSGELYREIILTQGQVALVDACDYEWINQWKWYAAYQHRTFYAQRRVTIAPKTYRSIYMHCVILGLERGDGRQGDHKNRHTLDNRRCNLRIATRSQNQANTKSRSACGMKGAYWRKDVHKWQAQIGKDRKLKSLGFFSTAEEAHAAYRLAAIELHGEFARFD